MTMDTKSRSVPASTFKARCLALLDEVATTGRDLVVTKRGRAVARVVPVEPPRPLLSGVRRERDIVSPVAGEWEAAR